MRLLLLFFTIAGTNMLFAQKVDIKVLFNNINDSKSLSQTTEKIHSTINSNELLTALQNNPHVTDKNLLIQVSFYDRGYFGEMALKQENTISPDAYAEQWKQLNEFNNGILFLFTKNQNTEKYSFHKIHVTPTLEEEYLLPLIIEFINNKLSGEVLTIVSNGAKYLAKSLDPVWNDRKMAEAEGLINNNPKYKPGHVNFFHNWFRFGFFNLKPATVTETEQMKLVNAWSKIDMSDKNWFFSDQYIFTNSDQVKGFDPERLYDWQISFEEDKISSVYIFKDAFLYGILSYIEKSGKHHATKVASQWPWRYDRDAKPTRFVTDFTGFADRSKNDRLILFFDESLNTREGDPIPTLSGSSQNTWCNIYACDLANEILFGNVFGDVHNGPWGSNQCANGLHYRIYQDRANFKEVSLEEAWMYSMKGFVVYLTMFHKSMPAELINTSLTEKALCEGYKSGHITTCFPRVGRNDPDGIRTFGENYVIQAGAEIGIGKYSSFIGEKYNSKVKAHIFLGYLTK